MTEDRLRELIARSHERDAAPGFAAALRGARAAAAPVPRRSRPLVAACAGLAAAAALVWLVARERAPAAPALVAPSLDAPGPFDQLPSPFPGLALADLTLEEAALPTAPEGLPIEEPW